MPSAPVRPSRSFAVTAQHGRASASPAPAERRMRAERQASHPQPPAMTAAAGPSAPRRQLLSLLLASPLLALASACAPARPPLRIGLLHSQTGTMALSEKPLIDAALLAVEQINAAGGIGGRRIEAVVADGASDAPSFARAAERLIEQDQVVALFGCWTSASRKAVKPVVERRRHLLFYPLQYEGMEQSPNVIYTGLTPNQQIVPALGWAARTLGRRVYLLGSDYVFPRTANLVVREYAALTGIEIVGERYLPLGSEDVAGALADIDGLRPDVVLNTINGDSNLALFRALAARVAAGAAPVPTLSFSLGEVEAQRLGAAFAGHYAAWSYFQSLPGAANAAFVAAFRARYGADRPITDPMATAYAGVLLWANAVGGAESAEPAAVAAALAHRSVAAPMGLLALDAQTHHVLRALHIGKARADGQFDIVWSSDGGIAPRPFPIRHTAPDWQRRLAQAGLAP